MKRCLIRTLIWMLKRLLPYGSDVIIEWRNPYPQATNVTVTQWPPAPPIPLAPGEEMRGG